VTDFDRYSDILEGIDWDLILCESLVDLNVNSQMNGMYDNDSCDETISVIKDSAEPVPCPLLSPLDKPVPSNWETIEGDFISALAIYLPYLGPDNLASPDSRLNDGCINLLLIKGGVSKKDLISMFLKFSTVYERQFL
jgi:hypothetical protein